MTFSQRPILEKVFATMFHIHIEQLVSLDNAFNDCIQLTLYSIEYFEKYSMIITSITQRKNS